MTVCKLSNSHFLPNPGWSLRSDPVINISKRYTPNEGVRGSGWVALSTRSDRAVTIGGIAGDYLVELPGLGKSGGTIDRPKFTQRAPPWSTPEWTQLTGWLFLCQKPDGLGRDSLSRLFPDGSGIEPTDSP